MSAATDALRRAYLAVTRGITMVVDDSKAVQTVGVRLLYDELPQKIERLAAYGFHSVHNPPDQNGGKGAEVAVAFVNGDRSHPIVVADGDRRTRPKNLKPGETIHHDGAGQYSKMATDGHHMVAKQHTLTAAGDGVQPGALTKPDATPELNEQLKGLSARAAQLEHGLHALFDVTSQFRSLVQQSLPQVAAVAPILNQDPSGLQPMFDAIAGGKQAAYLQQHMPAALGKFLTPNIGGVGSLIAGGLEEAIADMAGQIAGLVTGNPVVGQVDALVAELEALTGSGGATAVIQQGAAVLQQQITALTQANPIIAQVAGLRQALDGLMAQAGPALNFLAPQKRLVEGLSQSLRLAKAA